MILYFAHLLVFVGNAAKVVICSKHFKPDDFARRLDVQEENGILLTPWLNKRDEFGITAFPSIHALLLLRRPT